MPATTGRVRMPHNNRVSTSASLKTSHIWQNAIGHDPYAGQEEKEEPHVDAAADAEKAKKMMELARTQNVTDGATRDDFARKMYLGLKGGKRRRADAENAGNASALEKNKLLALDDENSVDDEEEFVQIVENDHENDNDADNDGKDTHRKSKSKKRKDDKKRKKEKRKRRSRRHKSSSSSSDDSDSSSDSDSSHDHKRKKRKKKSHHKRKHRDSSDSDSDSDDSGSDSSSSHGHRKRKRREKKRSSRKRGKSDRGGKKKVENENTNKDSR